MKNIYMRFPGGFAKALTLSYDDAVRDDYRLIEIMKKNGLCGTFNINSGLFGPDDRSGHRLSAEEVKELYSQEGIEPAIHGTLHPVWSTQEHFTMLSDIFIDRQKLEEMFGHPIRGGAYPYGAYNDKVVEHLDTCGIRYCRTTVSTGLTAMPENWLTLHPTCHHNNPRLMELARKFAQRDIPRDPGMFYLWGHSYEFPRDNNWNVIEEFAEFMGGAEGIWHATNIEIYDYTKAFESLQFTLNGDCVYNPTCTEVWFKAGHDICSVKPGETLKI